MLRVPVIAMASIAALVPLAAGSAEQPKTLMTRIIEWRYPDAQISGATMSDVATVDDQGVRTEPSIQCKALLTTADPIDKVFDYYHSKLTKKAAATTPDKSVAPLPGSPGRAVTFHSDTEGRPVRIHVISIISERMSTTLVLSRATGESKTHIAWSQYERFNVAPEKSELTVE
ncbi:hypothetical protein GC176_03705 [bacterium]|nr:hypothetical protein [bacterium]